MNNDRYWEDNSDLFYIDKIFALKIYKPGEDTADRFLFVSEIYFFKGVI